ncbi:GNAT family N-acetyltransferase [bacterium]|nr:GNAT family N-acetyltransferase [bacterium]
MVIAEDQGPVGFIALHEAFLAMTPEIAALSQRLYGDDFEAVLGPRLAALGRVQSEYPDGCLRVSEIHVDPTRRSDGIGRMLIRAAVEQAVQQNLGRVGLQTLVGNPARHAFEAWGFDLVSTTTDEEFQRLSGAAGYHLMVLDV